MYKIYMNAISEQGKICNYLLQIVDTPDYGRCLGELDNFVEGVTDENAWRENFHMSKDALVALSEALRPYIEGVTTKMRAHLRHRIHTDFLPKTLV